MEDTQIIKTVNGKEYYCTKDIKQNEHVACFDSVIFEFVGFGIAEEVYGENHTGEYTDVWAFGNKVNFQYPALKLLGLVYPERYGR